MALWLVMAITPWAIPQITWRFGGCGLDGPFDGKTTEINHPSFGT
jgi:hypothetical protein